MNWNKVKYFFSLYWIRILVISLLVLLGISVAFFLGAFFKSWATAESYLRQSILTQGGFQLYIALVASVISGIVFVGLWWWLLFKQGAGGFTTQKKKAISGETIAVTWNDVIGLEEAKQEALEVVRLIKDRAELQRIGGRILRGILMVGPPGCGKTYLAKAIATESGLPFITMSGSEFVEMFVGVGASRIRNLFKQARNLAEMEGGCIVFIDEIDAVGAQRAADRGMGGQTEFNTTLNQLLVEMDGLKEKDYNVVLIGATNMPEGFLDPALLRPGRFDRKIYVARPGLEDRQALLAYYLKKVRYDTKLNLEQLAKVTVGATPADIANIVQEAALITVRNKKDLIGLKEIDEARERIALGIKRRVKRTEEEKLAVAYHEAGHAVVTYLLVPSKDVFKASIIPRKETGGVTWIPEKREEAIPNKEELLGDIKVGMGGYAAELSHYGQSTSGVDSDFAQAMQTAHNMVWRWGMGKSGILGNFYTNGNCAFRIFGELSNISEETKSKLDQDVQDILQGCLKEVKELLHKEKAILDHLSQELVKKEELTYDEIEEIFQKFGKSRSQIAQSQA